MKKFFLIMVMIALAGCSNGFLRTVHPELEQNQDQIAKKEEFRSEKIYRILEDKGIYYVVKLESAGAVITEKDQPAMDPAKTSVTNLGGQGESKTQSQVQIATIEKRPELKIEVPNSDFQGRDSGRRISASTNLIPDFSNVQTAKAIDHSKEVDVSGQTAKKESYGIGKKMEKEVTAPIKPSLGKTETGLKPLEDISSQKDRRVILIFFTQDRAFLLKGAPEHNRLNSFAESLSREAGGKKLFFALIGSASAIGDSDYNRSLSQRRAQFVRKVLDGLLVNAPHEYHKVYGQGDSMSPKTEDIETNEKHQSVRIIAVYDIRDFPETLEK